MFPGLAWNGKTPDGRTTPDYFRDEMIPLLKARADQPTVRVIAIDTTNSGGAIGLSGRPIEAAAQAAGVSRCELTLLAVVNASHESASSTIPERLPMKVSTDGFVVVKPLTPNAPSAQLRHGQIISYTRPNP